MRRGGPLNRAEERGQARLPDSSFSAMLFREDLLNSAMTRLPG